MIIIVADGDDVRAAQSPDLVSPPRRLAKRQTPWPWRWAPGVASQEGLHASGICDLNRFMAFVLSDVEARILGCLLEKERLTPENYPLTLRALTLACNQTTSREPVVNYPESLVEEHLFELRQKKLASLVMTAGARVQKYRHHLSDHFELSEAETALLCVLLLRGPQTAGELRSRTERMHRFEDVSTVEGCLQTLIDDPNPLIQTVPARPGQKEKRYVQLLSGPPDLTAVPAPEAPVETATPRSRVEVLQEEVAQLRQALEGLRTEFQEFRKQFE